MTISVSGVNAGPTAQNVSANAHEEGPAVLIGGLADDVDQDDDPASLNYSILTAGSLSNNGNGTFTFSPALIRIYMGHVAEAEYPGRQLDGGGK